VEEVVKQSYNSTSEKVKTYYPIVKASCEAGLDQLVKVYIPQAKVLAQDKYKIVKEAWKVYYPVVTTVVETKVKEYYAEAKIAAIAGYAQAEIQFNEQFPVFKAKLLEYYDRAALAATEYYGVVKTASHEYYRLFKANYPEAADKLEEVYENVESAAGGCYERASSVAKQYYPVAEAKAKQYYSDVENMVHVYYPMVEKYVQHTVTTVAQAMKSGEEPVKHECHCFTSCEGKTLSLSTVVKKTPKTSKKDHPEVKVSQLGFAFSDVERELLEPARNGTGKSLHGRKAVEDVVKSLKSVFRGSGMDLVDSESLSEDVSVSSRKSTLDQSVQRVILPVVEDKTEFLEQKPQIQYRYEPKQYSVCVDAEDGVWKSVSFKHRKSGWVMNLDKDQSGVISMSSNGTKDEL